MSVGRFLSCVAASLAVAGCGAVAIGMSRSTGPPDPGARQSAVAASRTARPAFLPPWPTAAPGTLGALTAAARLAASAPRGATSDASGSSAPAGPASATRAARPAVTTRASATHLAAPAGRSTPRPAARTTATHQPAPTRSAPARGQSLPLRYSTGSATRVITVVAHSYASTTATLQAWNKAAGGGWRRYGRAVTAHIGADGMSTHPSESRSASPIGSFTLTLAFGHYSNPGTGLPYIHTTPSDWWISQPGRLYNTHQRCSSSCSFTRGAPNEHLYYETPYYDYAVNIDYNTRNAPGGVHQGRGSAFFLHVTDGAPTAGCVAIPQSSLVPIMRWLTPSAHPRMLIGVS